MLPWLIAATVAFAADAPEISRSAGTPAGVVVLFPRMVPRPAAPDPETSRLAAVVQQRLDALVAAAFPAAPRDVRPEPERVCPAAGCAGVNVGAVLVRNGNGCAVVATLSPPGKSDAALVPWVGVVDLAHATLPFREPPESSLTIRDFAPCSDLISELDAHASAVATAVAALPVPPG